MHKEPGLHECLTDCTCDRRSANFQAQFLKPSLRYWKQGYVKYLSPSLSRTTISKPSFQMRLQIFKTQFMKDHNIKAQFPFASSTTIQKPSICTQCQFPQSQFISFQVPVSRGPVSEMCYHKQKTTILTIKAHFIKTFFINMKGPVSPGPVYEVGFQKTRIPRLSFLCESRTSIQKLTFLTKLIDLY